MAFRSHVRWLPVVAAVALAACSSGIGTTPSMLQSANDTYSQAQQLLTPPACKGQKTTPTHSTVTDTLKTTGGQACIPAIHGLGGSVAYPPANPSVKLTLTSSTTNYTKQLPSLGPGTPVFYLQLGLSGATSFGTTTPAGGGLTGKSIVAGQKYTIYGQATVAGFTYNFTPCYATATAGKYGGVIGGAGTLLKGLTVPTAATGILEVYSGQSTTGAC